MLSATPNRSRVVRRSVFFSLTLRFFFLFVTCASTWAAQPDRIVGVIDSGQVVVLKGNVNPKAQPQYDQGPVESSMKLPYVTILTKPTAAQQADLRRFLKQQQEP